MCTKLKSIPASRVNWYVQKDVPFGKPYKIIDSSELPDRSQRNQWDVDESDLTDGIGAKYSIFPEVIA